MSNKMVIVYTKETEKYANYLMQLISIPSREEDEQITVACWSLDEFKNSMSKMPSNRKVLFVGSNKKMDMYISEIKDTFNKHGMHYGWIGTLGVLRVDRDALSLTRKYKEFCRFAQGQQQELKEALTAKSIVTTSAAAIVAALLGPLFAIIPAVNLIKKVNKIADQKYICLVTVFYKDGLKKFLEGC